jgi:uncharacterized membrane protein YhaH (DUF805 family)
MSAALLTAGALGLSALALTLCARTLLGPLRAVLLELCGEPHRAEFWTHMAATCMAAVTVVSALMGVLVAPAQAALAAASVLRWTLLGVAAGLAAVVAVVAAFARRAAPPPSHGAGRPWSEER